MTERNPYENDSVDIPDFSSIKDEDEDIDRSIFTMNEEDEIHQDDEDEEYYDDEPKYHKVKQSALIVCIVVAALLVIATVFSIVWGVSKNNKYNSLKNEYDAYVTKAKETETTLNAKITELEAKINSSTSNGSDTNSSTSETVTYKVSSAVDTINIRSEASASSDRVKYDSLSSAVQSVVHKNSEGYAYVETNGSFAVYETKKDSDGNLWARIDTNAWVCVENGGTTWASKQ